MPAIATIAEPRPPARARLIAWRDALLTSPKFRDWATRFPLTRPIARRRTRALFDLCAGFVYSQVLQACVELHLFDLLAHGPQPLTTLAPRLRLPSDRAERLLDSAVSLRLLTRRGQSYSLGPLGAAMVGNTAVTAMVRHHAMLYADLADPVALLRSGPGRTQLAAYWPYGAAPQPELLQPPEVAAYSDLMAASQPLVAAQILDAYDLRPHRCLLDVGGGDGTFLTEVAKRAPKLQLKLFDLPAVAARAAARFGSAGLPAQATGGDMLTGPLPEGADIVSLVRVIHDHDDAPALEILRNVRRVLPPNGTLLLAEPMAGTKGAEPIGGAYFAFYLLALGSGRARTPETLTAMLIQAGFTRVQQRRTGSPLLASLIVAHP